MPEGFHPPVEEYLATMYELEEEGTSVIRARLAERLGHSAPSVTEMVRRLIDDGYVEVSPSRRSLHLTDTGQKLAESVVRKHRLAERLLTDVIGLEWHKTHREAGRWEHVISDEVEERLIAVLGNPKTCPHGNPIPGVPQARRKLRSLADVEPGTRITLERVSESVELDLDTLTYLDENGLRPGVAAEVMTRAPDGTVMVGVDGGTLAIGSELAENLYAATA